MSTFFYQTIAILGFTELPRIWQWIIVFMVINSVSAAILRKALISATTRVHTVRHGKANGKADFFQICGVQNSSISAFNYILDHLHDGDGVYALCYSNFGFDVPTYVTAMRKAVVRRNKEFKRLSRTTIGHSISIGDIVIHKMENNFDATFSLNPCTYGFFLKEPLHTLLKYGGPLLLTSRFLLGWLGFIPIIPNFDLEKTSSSLALLIDQYLALRNNTRDLGDDNLPRNLILSEKDYLLDNEVVRKTFTGAHYAMTSNPHGDTRNTSDLLKPYYDLCGFRHTFRPITFEVEIPEDEKIISFYHHHGGPKIAKLD